ncbi:MAG: hypothetical protein IJ242_11610, partial [Clostridia bacterium]|nr:hypothetical protein [Clostridia bacterium]
MSGKNGMMKRIVAMVLTQCMLFSSVSECVPSLVAALAEGETSTAIETNGDIPSTENTTLPPDAPGDDGAAVPDNQSTDDSAASASQSTDDSAASASQSTDDSAASASQSTDDSAASASQSTDDSAASASQSTDDS